MNSILKLILWLIVWNWGCLNARSAGATTYDKKWWNFILPVIFAFLLGGFW